MKYFFLTLAYILLINILSSQTGPGGAGTSVDNVLWLKADKGTFSDAGVTTSTVGSLVQQWNDQSGNTKHAIQTNATSKPTWQTNVFNGLPALQFDGANDGILSAGLSTNATVTFFAVIKMSTLSKANPGVLQGSPTGLGYSVIPGDKSIGMWVNSVSQKIWGRGIQTSNTQRNIPQGNALATNTAYITANRYDGVNIQQFVNNTISGTVSYNGTLNSWTDVAIGTQGTETWNGYISEIIVYNKSLNDAERNIVDNYLSSKYNIPLASNDKYAGDEISKGDFDKDVAGLGKESSGSTNSFSASISRGLTVSTNSGLDNGDYILVGHSTQTNSSIMTDVGGMTGSNNARWSRTWYMDVTNTSTTINTNIEFDYSEGGVSGLPLGAVSNYVLLYRSGLTGNWTELTTASGITGDIVEFNNASLTTDGYYTIGTKNYTASPLPIELLSFDAIVNDKRVDLKWATATETNNDFFTVEKSKDGLNFESLNSVQAAGTTNTLRQYKDVDYEPFEGISYYRLKQTDLNRTNTYSKIVAVTYSTNYDDITIFPNPSDKNINLYIKGLQNQQITVVIRDEMGKECYSKIFETEENNQIIALDREANLAKGTYIVEASSNTKSYTKKVIVK